MADEPRVSVLVGAYLRNPYQALLFQALDSLRRQTLPSDAFEVIVTTNLDPLDCANHAAGLNVRWLPHTGNQGEATSAGIRESRGSVLVMIDYDDLFLPQKLQIVDQVFRSSPNIGYFHNNFSIVNEKGDLLPSHPLHQSARAALSQLGPITLAGEDVWSSLDRYPSLLPDFNSSCISFRRDILRDRLPAMNRILQDIDRFLFFAAILSRYDIWIDSRILTLYRVHSHNTSKQGTRTRDADRTYHSRRALDLEVMVSMAMAAGDTVTLREIEEALRLHRFHEALSNPGATRRVVWEAWTQARKLRNTHIWRVSNRSILNTAALFYLAWPRVARRIGSFWTLRRFREAWGGG